MLYQMTGDEKYVDWMDACFWDVHEEIFDHDAGLFYRDARSKPRKDEEWEKSDMVPGQRMGVWRADPNPETPPRASQAMPAIRLCIFKWPSHWQSDNKPMGSGEATLMILNNIQ